MQRLERLGPARSTWNRSDYNQDDNVDVEAVALSTATESVANLGLQYDGFVEVAFQFGEENFNLNIDSKENPSWVDLIVKAKNHKTVTSYFNDSTLGELKDDAFSLILPSSYTNDEDKLLRHGSEQSFQPAELRLVDPLILFYVPKVHVCQYDGLRISVPFLGHWLHVDDRKGESNIVVVNKPYNRGAQQKTPVLNNQLLAPENDKVFCKLLMRLSKFMKNELKISGEEYAISVPFGGWVATKTHVHARVQLADPGVFWTLMANFEEYLARGNEPGDATERKRLGLLASQRNLWNRMRFIDYRDWATTDSTAVREEYESVGVPPKFRSARHGTKLPPGFHWDDHGRMQLHHQMSSALEDMQGAMGSIPDELKQVVAAFQSLSRSLRAKTFYLIIHNQSCSFAVPPLKYMQVLHSANGNAQLWANKFLDSIQTPERLYSGLLAEGAGLVKCDNEVLDEAINGTGGSRPALHSDVIESLRERSKIDRRLFLEREIDQSATANTPQLSHRNTARGAAPKQANLVPKKKAPVVKGPPKPTMANVVSRNSNKPTTARWHNGVSKLVLKQPNSRAKQLQEAVVGGTSSSTNKKSRAHDRRNKLALPFKEPSAPPPQTLSMSPGTLLQQEELEQQQTPSEPLTTQEEEVVAPPTIPEPDQSIFFRNKQNDWPDILTAAEKTNNWRGSGTEATDTQSKWRKPSYDEFGNQHNNKGGKKKWSKDNRQQQQFNSNWRDSQSGTSGKTAESTMADDNSNWRDRKLMPSNMEKTDFARRYEKTRPAGEGFNNNKNQFSRRGKYNNRNENQEQQNPPAAPARPPMPITASAFDGKKKSAKWATMDREDRDFGIMGVSNSNRHHRSAFSTQNNSKNNINSGDRGSLPGPGYSCRICGQAGGQSDSHWFQQCPSADPQQQTTNSTANTASQNTNHNNNKRPPGIGYVCKICGAKGGEAGAHWLQQCPENEDGQYTGTNAPIQTTGDESDIGGGFTDFWKGKQSITEANF